MKVKELIEILQQFDEDVDVVIETPEVKEIESIEYSNYMYNTLIIKCE